MASDWDLLERYERAGDQEAFAALAKRHVNVVFGAARRMLGGPGQEAEDVTQAVFLLLSRRAGSIPHHGSLAGWLFKATRYCCANVRKGEGRRRGREREAAMMRSEVEVVAEDLRPMLDEGLAKLREKERQAILVRCLENRTAAETGEVLGISAEAVEKRLERGLERLRAFFTNEGYSVGCAGVAAVLAVEEAKGVPAGLAASIGSGVKGGGSVALIAKGAAAAMMWVKVLTAGAVAAGIIATAGVGVMIAARLPGTATGPGSAPTVAGAQGLAMCVRWDIVVNQAGADRLKGLLTPVKTESKEYEAFTADAEALRLAGQDAAAAGELLLGPRQLGWASMNSGWNRGDTSDFALWSSQADGRVLINPAQNVSVSVHTAALPGTIYAERRRDAIRLRIEGQEGEVWLLPNDGATVRVRKNVQLRYSGDVPVGQAAVMLGDLGEIQGVRFWHVAVFQVFRADEQAYPYLIKIAPHKWLEEGFETSAAAARRTLAWNGQAVKKLTDVAPAWEKRLPNGGILRLVAVNVSDSWPDCWWDPQGVAVAGDPRWRPQPSSMEEEHLPLAVVQAEDPSVPEPTRDEASRTMQVNSSMGNARRSIAPGSFKGDWLKVGLAAGPWTEAGPIAMGASRRVEGVEIELLRIETAIHKGPNMKGSSWLHINQSSRAEVEIQIVAFDKEGKEIVWRQAPVVYFERDGFSATANEHVMNVDADGADVARYAVRWRPRDWVTFNGFAIKPRVSPDEIGVQVAFAEAAKPASASQKVRADASTPQGLMEAVKAALDAADAKALRGLMYAPSAPDRVHADSMAQDLASREILRKAAESRFGAAETKEALGSVMSYRNEMEKFEWEIKGDEAFPAGEGMGGSGRAALVRTKGEWRVNMTIPPEAAVRAGELEKQAKMMAGLVELRSTLAKQTREGKFKDGYELRDALRDGTKEIESNARK